MTSLLIVAHGSRRQSSNHSLMTLAKQVAFHLPMNIDDVHIGFLEFAQPTVQSCIDSCFKQGTNRLLVLPYFLAQGNHVSEDIPKIIASAKRKWPHKQLSVLPHIGAMEEMSTLIAKRCLEELMKHHDNMPPKTSPQYFELGDSNYQLQ